MTIKSIKVINTIIQPNCFEEVNYEVQGMPPSGSLSLARTVGHPVFWMTGICEYATKRKTFGLLEACLSGDKVQVTSSDKGMNQIENNYLQTLSFDNHKVPISGKSTIFGS